MSTTTVSHGEFYRQTCGKAIVTFGHGVSIAEIIFRSDYSTLALFNIPAYLDWETLREELRSAFKSEAFSIRYTEFNVEVWTRSAIVKIADGGHRSRTVVHSSGRKKLGSLNVEFEALEMGPSFARYFQMHSPIEPTVITLHGVTWLAVRKGAFVTIAAALGDKVKLDRKAIPPRIYFNGTKREANWVRRILRTHPLDQPDIIEDFGDIQGERTCSVDWMAAEDPVMTSCGHIYCRSCLNDQAIATSDFPLRCVGNRGECNKPLSLDDLSGLLPKRTFMRLLKTSRTRYIHSHPEDFRYCPTPNCKSFYRVSRPEYRYYINCKECHASTCTTCHESSHPGLTCAQARNSADGMAEFNEWKKENDVRECPKCKTSIQKAEGCNSVVCWSCKAEICWACMGSFDSIAALHGHILEGHPDSMTERSNDTSDDTDDDTDDDTIDDTIDDTGDDTSDDTGDWGSLL